MQFNRASGAPSGALFISGGSHKRSRPVVGHGGGKSGGGGRSPKEAPDSLHSTAYARIIDLVSEGEIFGPTHGLGGALRDVYLDGTPVANEDGSLNFQNVAIDFRTGTQTQDPLPGFPASEVTTAANVELTAALPWVRSFADTQLSAIRITLAVNGLSQANTSNGDITGYRVEYRIEVSTDGGAYQTALTSAFDGKTTQRYARSHRIDLPSARSGWSVRVVRTTANAGSSTVSDRTFVDAYTEVIDAKLRYPMSAVFGIKVDASQFQNVPVRAYDLKGRIIRVPSNYDPESRAYSGTWDGTFKLAWTDNPAWIFFDLVSNDRYGLGERIPAGWLDKWGLYQIARYCDELVPDGFGGQEPRFTCNVYLQTAADAYRVLQDLASVFRGMAYWASGSVFAVADMPGDPIYTFTSANVIDGRFHYAGSALNTRYTVALVSWNDLSDMGRQKVEYVEDRRGLLRYGLRQIEVSAFGCTSRGQANRVGKWLLLTSQMETRSVSFAVGLDSCRVHPGSIIRVADQHLAGRRIGGRIHAATGKVITVDAALGVRPGDRLTVNLPSGVSETRIISTAVGQGLTADMTTFTVDSIKLTADMVGLPGTVLILTVTAPYSEVPEPECVWTLESETLSAQRFRVLSVKRKEGLVAEIFALQHEPGKFDNVDFGTRLEPVPITVIPPGVQPPPTEVTITSYPVISQGFASHTAVFSWKRADSAVAYEVQWRRDNSEWVNMPRTGSTSVEVPNVYAGAFLCRVRALNALDIASMWASSTLTQLDGILAPPPAVTSLVPTALVFAIRLKWGLPAGPSILERTEIWYSASPAFESAQKLGDFAFPQDSTTLMGLSAGARLYFWAILRDRNGVAGPRYPAGNGVLGQASSDAGEILDYLTGKITQTQLARDILAPIERIPVLETRIAQEETTRQAQNEAMAQTISTVSAKVNENTGLIQQESLIRTNENEAMGRRLTDVQATAGAASQKADQAFAGVQETSQAIAKTNGDLSAMWTIKAQTTAGGRSYMAGIGVGVSNTGGIVESQVLVMADRFAVLHPNGSNVTSPFVIQGGQVFMSQALIGTGWITNAMIGSYIQSDNYVAGVSGWRIDKAGNFEMNGSNGAGRLLISPGLMRVYDANGVLRVRVGNW
ncbi:host specificity protein J [Achromobacter xylosoxidans]|uniref:Host specificity protein J n=2 Tax=Alcaligenaceae TaxID=506 RepID=A0A424W4W7_ALCXX|nr:MULTISPECIES: host specificity protein J [Achromobacter]MBC9908513.1 host specificity protein J [Achromobacter xylosoxidans]MBD0872460.1 host specificity protein J [Achromobacter xylosoxidans]QNP88986.1 host specificity protein J [Achromobacter xylosoxidans]RPJ88280.1 host specificity protein J [Achromobacter xylosoxidans]